MKIIIIFVIPFLLAFSCSSNSINLSNFKPVEMTINKSFNKSVSVLNSIVLKENDKVIIQNISGCETSQFGNKLLVVDIASARVILYDNKIGEIINQYKISNKLFDSLAISDVKIQAYEANRYRKFKFESLKELRIDYKKNKYDTAALFRTLANSINSAKYYNDNIFLTTTIRMPLITIDSLKPFLRDAGNRACILKLDSNLNLLKFIPTQCKVSDDIEIAWIEFSKKFPLGFSFSISNNLIYLSAENEFYSNQGSFNSFDSLTSIMKFDMFGNEISIANFLPDDYCKSRQGYNLQTTPMFASIMDTTYVAYPYGTTIKNLTDNSKFEIYNLPFTNRAGFDYLIKRTKQFSVVSKQTLSESNKVNLLPIRIWKIFRKGNNILVWLAIVKELAPHKYGDAYIIQEYTTNGKLIAYTMIEKRNANGEFRNVTYDNANKQFLFFRKDNKKGWTMEKVKWE